MNKATTRKIKKTEPGLKTRLAEKTFQLKVESALEKVTSVAMKMKQPADMLKICRTISLQLKKLGVEEIRNVQTAIFYPDRSTYMNYEYYAKHDKTFITETTYNNNKIHKAFAVQMLKGKGRFFIKHIRGKQVKDWIDYQKTTNVFLDKYLDKASSLNYYWYSLGPVALGISTYDPLTKKGQELFRRFLKVFELAYRRYLDIEKAAAQAYGARIEASLERVRAQAMSIRKSEELAKVAEIIFKELKLLGFSDIRNTEIIIYKEEKNAIRSYYCDYGVNGTIDIDTSTHPTIKEWLNELKKTNDSFASVHIPEKEMKEWRKYRELLGYLPDIKLNKAKTVEYYSYSIGLGALSISSFKPITDEQLKTLERFKNIFGLAYRRYADITQAELQTKEAEIELALERVRARTMAMQQSEELSEAVYILFQQFRKLGENPDQATIGIVNEKEHVIEYWVTMYGNQMNKVFKFSIDEPNVTNKIYKAWKENKKSLVIDLGGKALSEFMTYRAGKGGAAVNTKEKRRIINVAFFSKGLLNVQSNEERSDESIKLLERFAKVFEQTYTRFLDLQKAEAQAREAEIELALERVRARTMAMQKSEELQEVVHTVLEKLKDLNVEFYTAIIILFAEDSKDITWWLENKEKQQYSRVLVPYADIAYLRDLFDSRGNGKDHFSRIYSFEEKNELFHHLFNDTDFQYVPGRQKKFLLESEAATMSVAIAKNTGIHLTRYTDKAFSEADNEILKRFAKVFEQAYTRFLDLQKAEAQAREAQIEIGLERVRSRAMAMQSSEELNALIGTVFTELTKLDLELTRCRIWVFEPATNAARWWMANIEEPLNPMSFFIKYHEHPAYLTFVKEWKNQNVRFVYDLKGKDKTAWDEILFNETELKNLSDVVKNGMRAPERVLLSASFNNFGGINVASLEPLSDEHFDILLRFAKVFDLTYTRFLDLKNAEAQVREAQIEAALEKVRSRSLAMHKSDELSEVVTIVFKKLRELAIELDVATILIPETNSDSIAYWVANTELAYSTSFLVPYFDHTIIGNETYNAIQNRTELFTRSYSFGEKNEMWQYLFEFTDFKNAPENRKKFILDAKAWTISLACTRNTGIQIVRLSEKMFLDSENEILKRFAKVFEQAYIRFLDLQKAEAQAREAQIEAALEKVRSRSLAMHKSEELHQVVTVVFERMKDLNITMDAVNINIFYKGSRDVDLWIASPGQDYASCFHLPYINDFVPDSIFNAKEKGESFFAKTYSFEEKNKYFNHLFTYSDFKYLPEERKRKMLEGAAYAVSFAFTKNAAISIHSFAGKLFSEQENEILKRFSNVFEQAYIRFLDLQKAEAQAREAQIENALEKVRSRSLAMHKSDELNEVVMVLFERLKDLQIPVTAVGIHIFSEGSKDLNVYVCGDIGNGLAINNYLLPYFNHPIADDLYDAHEKGLDFFVGNYSKKQKDSFYQHLFEHSALRDLPDDIKNMIFQSDSYSITMAPVKNSVITVNDFEGKPLSDAGADVIKRFAKVFEQSYIRFLDLQKAEAQAREAQIQLALERVRARTMAMQRSEELSETAYVLFQQFVQLGENPIQITIGIIKEEERIMEFRVTDWGGSGSKVNIGFNVSIDEPTLIHKIFKAWKKNESSIVIELVGTELEGWLSYRNKVSGVNVKSTDTAGRRVISVAFFSKGMIAFSSPLPPVQESVAILERFANVFDGTYTRFLDLQKAEAQAREAQIETALERVRSRSMGMQKSEELKEVIQVVYDQFVHLNIHIEHTGFLMDYKARDDMHIWLADQHLVPSEVTIPWFDSPPNNSIKEAKEKGQDFFKYLLTFEEKNKFYRDLFRFIPDVPEATLEYYFNCPGLAGSGVLLDNIGLYIENFSGTPYTDEENNILMRFGKVFQQTYTRFLDLQNAEAQARESQIQLALERVRARTMAMQHSDELGETASVLFEQFDALGEVPERVAIEIVNEKEHVFEIWATQHGGRQLDLLLKCSLDEPHVMQKMYKAWKEQKRSITIDLQGKELEEYFEFLKDAGLPVQREIFGKRRVQNVATFSKGILTIITPEPRPQETIQLLERFAAVFDGTYTRFLDLQKAEAQVREAQIEAALERVRGRTMAMHKSSELLETAELLFDQLKQLGAELQGVAFAICDKNSVIVQKWTSIGIFSHPYTIEPGEERMYEAWKNQAGMYEEVYEGERQKKYYEAFMQIPAFKQGLQKFIDSGYPLPTWQKNHAVTFKHGYLLFITTKPFNETQIFLRFGKVFEQTYTRFLDLQKAEAQAREAQIEASLERVRSKTMAMHNSHDVGDTVATMFDELVKLGVETNRCGILIYSDTIIAEVWTAKSDKNEKATLIIGQLDLSVHPLLQGIYDAFKNKESFYTYPMLGDDLKKYYQAINDSQYYPTLFNMDALPEKEFHSDFFFPEGSIFAFTAEPIAAEASIIFKRFAGVFGQTYRRYLDLQKAEAQAREATIEAALEKVRGKAMAMHNSNDLSSTASVIFTELRKLGINPIRCGVGLLNKESRKGQLYSAASSAGGDSLSLVGWVELSNHPVLEKIYDTWLKNEEYYPELSGEQLKSYYELLLKGLPVAIPDLQNEQKQYGHFLPFSVGCLYAWSEAPYNDTEIKILKRFAAIIDLTFRRYIELQKSEASAKDAVKQAALDRIRADIASMRTISDLDRITPLIWNELTILGIPFIRCGVFIMDEMQQLIHTFLSTPDGKAIAAFHLSYDTPGNISKVVSNWKEKKNYIDHWDEEEFMQFAEILVQQGALVSAESYLKTIPHGGFYLHFLPFLQGMLYVGNTTQLGEDEISLIQSITDAFSTAYARYEDFNKLEAAKKQVDTTLNELQVTQKQLIQSEKMASLGELTAGIAHEIQNPLNFVNNFSEVSKELLDEMKEAIEKGDTEDAKEIMNDVIQNLEKINHHGKRADGIVKGMLQHSRSSSGQKEPTDINALADEYLRLAYHGLRAKDKSFNATMKTDYDETLEKVNVIPQDIGRVILNLITNAFYAVTEKKKMNIENYEPVVTVKTSMNPPLGGRGAEVFISVKDNGNGISQKVLDKIFQPFFTTKPTGSGTGLGLSLSYDIIKAHGGEIKVDTKVNEGTEFTIQLPAG